MMNNLFLIRNEKEYRVADKIIEKRYPDDFVMLSWSEKKPYITDTYCYLKKVMRWKEFQVKDMDSDRHWLKNYRQIEYLAREKINGFYQDEITRSPYFIFGLAWNIGDNYYKYIETLDVFFKNYKPKVIFFNPGKSFISGLMLSFMRIYGIKHESLAL